MYRYVKHKTCVCVCVCVVAKYSISAKKNFLPKQIQMSIFHCINNENVAAFLQLCSPKQRQLENPDKTSYIEHTVPTFILILLEYILMYVH